MDVAKIAWLLVLVVGVSVNARAELRTLKPGWNLFSPQQDIQIGKEAAAEVETKMAVVHNRELDGYLNGLLGRLRKSPHAGDFPYTIHAVRDNKINAFSLPGGPIFVNTGLISACENEAQLAGVIGHEMSHVALRHATNQASKQNLVAIPVILAGVVAGHSLLGQLAQLGLGGAASSWMLHFSRESEAQADYNGAEIMADAGYNPLALANFFEGLEKEGGPNSRWAQFLSDHPNPGNRVAAVEDEIRQMPQRSFSTDTGEFPRIKDLVSHLPAPGKLSGAYLDGHVPGPPSARPDGRWSEYRGNSYSLMYPENWQVFGDQHGNMVTVAPREGIIESGSDKVSIGYGLEISYYFTGDNGVDLARDSQKLVRRLMDQNPGMQAQPARSIQVSGQPGLETLLKGRSPYEGETEIDRIVTVARPEGLFYMVLIAPASEGAPAAAAYGRIVDSVRFF